MKNLLRTLSIALTMLPIAATAKGQKVFKTYTDYQKSCEHHLLDTTGERKVVHVHHFFWNASTVTIVENDKRHTYRKDSLYGYQNGANKVYRFYKNSEYELVEAGDIFIYTQQENIAQTKGYILRTVYYFSISPTGNIVRLNEANLKAAYPDNEPFLELMNRYFSNGSASQYDHQHKMFLVNYLMQRSLK